MARGDDRFTALRKAYRKLREAHRNLAEAEKADIEVGHLVIPDPATWGPPVPLRTGRVLAVESSTALVRWRGRGWRLLFHWPEAPVRHPRSLLLPRRPSPPLRLCMALRESIILEARAMGREDDL